MAKDNLKLELWQKRLADGKRVYDAETEKMDEREKLYRGERELKPLVPGDTKKDGGPKKTSHVRNIIFENIESQVSSAIPQPKVTARRKRDEPLAEIIEHFLRNELDRLPFEEMNDMAERTVPVQGGVGFLVEWDSTKRTHDTSGELVVSTVHPKQFAPQPGIYTGIKDMDWMIIKLPTTKEAVFRQYGVDVRNESESEPDIRAAGGEDHADDAVTQYIGFAVNREGGIDRYSWVNDTELEDLENYQARHQPVCSVCGRMKPLPGQPLGEAGERDKYNGGPCPWCGSEKFTDKEQEYEEVWLPMTTGRGLEIPGATLVQNEDGTEEMKPTLIPFYKPDVYPIVLQRSVSVYGQLLGNSDVDVIKDQQNTVNRMEQKIIDRLVKAGTRVTLPAKASLRTDPEDGERWFLDNPADKNLIDVYEFSGNLQYELGYLAQAYEEARQILGITDSFQGRHDATATSGVAKEFSAAQAAGRLESKRMMKRAAYANIFELMFKFQLAYADEPRPVSFKNFNGETEYQEFNRYDFLERDEEGNYWWNDQFLFSCDAEESLATNRNAMWQETRQNLSAGAFGNPQDIETLLLFWGKMEELHYPGANATKKFLEDRNARQQEAMQKAAQQQAMQQQMPAGAGEPQLSGDMLAAIERQAKEDAMRDAGINM